VVVIRTGVGGLRWVKEKTRLDRLVMVGRAGSFSAFMTMEEPRLRVALVAALGPERGREAAAEALAYAWEHWERVSGMEFPVAYLFQVGRSKTRSRRVRILGPTSAGDSPNVEPGLGTALRRLTQKQRISVVLVHAYEWRHEDVAGLLGISVPTVKTHVQRGLAKLRSSLGVGIDG
jgi:DNA-directed RNA polymerase specialized sigma24 family protein